MLIDKKVKDFLAELKSDSPAPGGGSAAALAGAVGAALGVMVGNLTVGSDKYAAVHEEARQLSEQLDSKLTSLEKYIDEDTEAFNQVMAAFKLAKSTDEEKNARSQAIQQALRQAAMLPLEVANCCLNVMELAGKMLAIGNPNAASDAAVAGRLAHAALWSAVYNVKINLGSIKDQAFVSDLAKQVDVLVQKADALLIEIAKQADAKI